MLKEELEVQKEKNTLLEEKLQLQKTSLLYSHNLILAILFGVVYGSFISVFVYLIEWFCSIQGLYRSIEPFSIVFFLFIFIGIPAIAAVPPVLVLKAPSFLRKELAIYALSTLFVTILTIYFDPLERGFVSSSIGSDRLMIILLIAFFQFLSTFLGVAAAFLIVDQFGYRVVFSGSAFSFEVDADIKTVTEQMKKLEEDFNLVLYESLGGPNKLYFTKTYGKEKIVLQIIFRQRDRKTEAILVMHSIVNDVPMRTGQEELRRIGRSIARWLESSRNFRIVETQDKTLIAEAVQEATKSFYRRPVTMPSRNTVKKFLKGHWKDILIITSFLIAILAWLFPR